jgi:2-polyprenyl-3-methyl-5-hydroxy-6-metoxy-1,4-benzoquinol methylase
MMPTTNDPFGPEISDLIVDYDPATLERKVVKKEDVLRRLREENGARAKPLRIAEALIANERGELDPGEVDGILVRTHLELQRLHEEFQVGATVRMLLMPMLNLVRSSNASRPEKQIRIVDLGCGLGYITRWLSKYGDLGEDVSLIGADYNRALVKAASTLAKEDGLKCTFVDANAFRLREPAHIYISTGVLHHFRGEDLGRLFAEHESSPALGFVHIDIRPSIIAPIGSYIFHVARMREPLAQWDGYWSAVRAHSAETLRGAIAKNAESFTTAMLDSEPGIYTVVRIFQAVVGVRKHLADDLPRAYSNLAHRLRT